MRIPLSHIDDYSDILDSGGIKIIKPQERNESEEEEVKMRMTLAATVENKGYQANQLRHPKGVAERGSRI